MLTEGDVIGARCCTRSESDLWLDRRDRSAVLEINGYPRIVLVGAAPKRLSERQNLALVPDALRLRRCSLSRALLVTHDRVLVCVVNAARISAKDRPSASIGEHVVFSRHGRAWVVNVTRRRLPCVRSFYTAMRTAVF